MRWEIMLKFIFKESNADCFFAYIGFFNSDCFPRKLSLTECKSRMLDVIRHFQLE